MQSLFFHDIWIIELYYGAVRSVNRGKMNNKTLGIIIVIFGSLVLFSKQEYAWIISAVSIGIGTGIFFWKDEKSDIEN